MQMKQNPNCVGIRAEVPAFLSCPVRRCTWETVLACVCCEHVFFRVNEVVQFALAEDFASGFGFQWGRCAHTQAGGNVSKKDFQEEKPSHSWSW